MSTGAPHRRRVSGLAARGLALILAAPFGAMAAVTHLTDADRQALPTLLEVRRVDAVPVAVWPALAKATGDGAAMANPGEKWQATDAILEENLPWRRLIFAGVSDRYCLLHYERGGIGKSGHLMLFRLDGGEARLVWSAGSGPIESLAKVPAALQSPAVDDDPRNLH